jgi:hypothetical protein
MHERFQVLGEEVLHEQGSFRRLRQYIAGWHPHLGALHFGWSGQETIVERDVILAARAVRTATQDGDAHDGGE